MLIAQISDPHITVPGKKAYGIASTDEYLVRCIGHINRLAMKPDLVVVSGDITNDGLPESTEHAASLLNGLECPFYVTPGNHDERQVIWSVFGGGACPSMDQGFIDYVIEGHELRLIGLDSTREGQPGGEVCHARRGWLERRLREDEHRPTIIFMHHPPVKCSVPETDEDGFEGAGELGGLVGKFANIEALICGHIHLPTHTRWHGTIVSTAPSTGMQLGLDLTMRHPSKFFLTAPGYQLHHFTGEGNLITHTIYVHENEDGPYPFEEHHDA